VGSQGWGKSRKKRTVVKVVRNKRESQNLTSREENLFRKNWEKKKKSLYGVEPTSPEKGRTKWVKKMFQQTGEERASRDEQKRIMKGDKKSLRKDHLGIGGLLFKAGKANLKTLWVWEGSWSNRCSTKEKADPTSSVFLVSVGGGTGSAGVGVETSQGKSEVDVAKKKEEGGIRTSLEGDATGSFFQKTRDTKENKAKSTEGGRQPPAVKEWGKS